MVAKINFWGVLAGAVLLFSTVGCSQEPKPYYSSVGAASSGGADKSGVELTTAAKTVEVISALPVQSTGAAISGTPEFKAETIKPEAGRFSVDLEGSPVWILEDDVRSGKKMSSERSPFGLHPAAVDQTQYEAAKEMGVVWDRPPQYIMWFKGQPDPQKDNYLWEEYDTYFKNIPTAMHPLRNITVVFDGLVEVPGRKGPGPKQSPSEDISRHLEGTTYRPKDQDRYGRWVMAVVERYDGDGIGDMPGLSIPCKFWQVDNEPPRGRKGYPDLVQITCEAIKKADPDAKVVMGGLMIPAGQFLAAYEDEILPMVSEIQGKHVDIMDFHWFGEAGDWRFFPGYMERVRKDLKARGFSTPAIWLTEMGTYSGQPSSRRGPSRKYQSEKDQAVEMVQRYVIAFSEGVEKVFWAWGLREGFGNPQDNDFFDNTGLIYDGIGPDDPGKGVRKVGFWSYQQMTCILQYWNGETPVKLETAPGITAFRFPVQDGQGKGIIVAWKDEPARFTKPERRDMPPREDVPRRRPILRERRF